jgi:hypothetical protein
MDFKGKKFGNPLSGGNCQTSRLKWGAPGCCSILAMTNEKWQEAGCKIYFRLSRFGFTP